MRYTFLGDRMTDVALVGQPCDPVRREDGKCIVGRKMAVALVVFGDGVARVVPRRRLRVREKLTEKVPVLAVDKGAQRSEATAFSVYPA